MAWRRVVVAGVAAVGLTSMPSQAAPVDVACRLEVVPAAVQAPVRLRLTLINRSPAVVWALVWGTPFEGWMQPFVQLTRDGVELPYRGPAVKRGDPDPDEYLRLVPRRPRSRTFMLSPAFDVDGPGLYRVEPRLVLHDVHAGRHVTQPSRPRGRHQPALLDCNAVEFTRP